MSDVFAVGRCALFLRLCANDKCSDIVRDQHATRCAFLFCFVCSCLLFASTSGRRRATADDVFVRAAPVVMLSFARCFVFSDIPGSKDTEAKQPEHLMRICGVRCVPQSSS